MRYSTMLEELSARPVYLLLTVLAMLIAMHLVLVVWLRLSDIAWKKVDYLWLAAAGLGLLAASAQSERILAKRYIEGLERPRTETAYQWLHALLAEAYVCNPPSPADALDPFRIEQAQFCNYGKETASKMPPRLSEAFPPLAELGFSFPPSTAQYPQTRLYAKEVGDAADRYRQQQARYADLLRASQQSEAELLFSILGPLLIGFALALRITKVSGEIANARRKAKA